MGSVLIVGTPTIVGSENLLLSGALTGIPTPMGAIVFKSIPAIIGCTKVGEVKIGGSCTVGCVGACTRCIAG